MPTVLLDPEGATLDRPVRVPRRFLLGPGEVETLAWLAGTRLPWAAEPAVEPRDRERHTLRAIGLLSPLGDLHPEVTAAMRLLGAPEVAVELDLALRQPAGRGPRLHSWQRFGDGVVASLSTALTGRFELAWYDAELWRGELVRLLRVPSATAATDTGLERLGFPEPAPATGLSMPLDLVLGTGEAVSTHRQDVFDELVARDVGAICADGRPLGPAVAHRQVALLHRSPTARLQAVGTGVGRSGRARIGWLSWLRFADGWRALTPYVEGGRAMVRVEPRRPADLGGEVARWVTAVRA